MHTYAARTSLEYTSKTCSDHAPSILLAATASPVFFLPHRIRLPHLMYAIAAARSFCIPENLQPVIVEQRLKKWFEHTLGG
jgi:hypothetical protein